MIRRRCSTPPTEDPAPLGWDVARGAGRVWGAGKWPADDVFLVLVTATLDDFDVCSSAKWIVLLCRAFVLTITGHLAVAQHLVEQRQGVIRQVATKFRNPPPLDFCIVVVGQFDVFGCCEFVFQLRGGGVMSMHFDHPI